MRSEHVVHGICEDDVSMRDLRTISPCVRGNLADFFEQGMSSVAWSVTEVGLMSYAGMHDVCTGDLLEVYRPDGSLCWHGRVNLTSKLPTTQRGMSSKRWWGMFNAGYRSLLTPCKPLAAHPFRGDTVSMRDRLDNLSDEQARTLYAQSLYPWFINYSQGGGDTAGPTFTSIGMRDIDLTRDELLAVLGASDSNVRTWSVFPQRALETLMPYDINQLHKVGLLCRVHGNLCWNLPTPALRRTWLDGWVQVDGQALTRLAAMTNIRGLEEVSAQVEAEAPHLPRTILDNVHPITHKAGMHPRVLACQDTLRAECERQGVSIPELARRMGVSRARAARTLDASHAGVTVDSLQRAAAALGKTLELRLLDD